MSSILNVGINKNIIKLGILKTK